jgi:Mrp family chromosome partitioning ATPase
MFTRAAEDAVQAVTSAIREAEAAGIQVTGVVANQVSIREIAKLGEAEITAAGRSQPGRHRPSLRG